MEAARLAHRASRLVRILDKATGKRHGFGEGGQQEVVSARGRKGGMGGAGESELELQRRRLLTERSKVRQGGGGHRGLGLTFHGRHTPLHAPVVSWRASVIVHFGIPPHPGPPFPPSYPSSSSSSQVKEALEAVRRTRALHRAGRSRRLGGDVPLVGLVGYTNAGERKTQ